jgi:hypothetical protein
MPWHSKWIKYREGCIGESRRDCFAVTGASGGTDFNFSEIVSHNWLEILEIQEETMET